MRIGPLLLARDSPLSLHRRLNLLLNIFYHSDMLAHASIGLLLLRDQLFDPHGQWIIWNDFGARPCCSVRSSRAAPMPILKHFRQLGPLTIELDFEFLHA